jgi:hypothetical protein
MVCSEATQARLTCTQQRGARRQMPRSNNTSRQSPRTRYSLMTCRCWPVKGARRPQQFSLLEGGQICTCIHGEVVPDHVRESRRWAVSCHAASGTTHRFGGALPGHGRQNRQRPTRFDRSHDRPVQRRRAGRSRRCPPRVAIALNRAPLDLNSPTHASGSQHSPSSRRIKTGTFKTRVLHCKSGES